MRGNTALAARIARLERALAPRPLPRLAFLIHQDDVPETAIEGFRTCEGTRIPRNPGEALSDLLRRAWGQPGIGLSLFACYPPDAEPVPAEPQPNVGTPAEPDPFALAGIGREATVAELTRMGIIPSPAERLITS